MCARTICGWIYGHHPPWNTENTENTDNTENTENTDDTGNMENRENTENTKKSQFSVFSVFWLGWWPWMCDWKWKVKFRFLDMHGRVLCRSNTFSLSQASERLICWWGLSQKKNYRGRGKFFFNQLINLHYPSEKYLIHNLHYPSDEKLYSRHYPYQNFSPPPYSFFFLGQPWGMRLIIIMISLLILIFTHLDHSPVPAIPCPWCIAKCSPTHKL